MTKSDLIKQVAADTGQSQKWAASTVQATLDAISQAVAEGTEVQLVGFGTFKAATRKERLGVLPGTKSPIVIPAKRVPTFHAGKAFREAVNK